MMLFSQRYFQAVKDGRLTVELSADVRKKLWKWLIRHDDSVLIQPDSNDNWTTTSSILAEVEDEIKLQHGWDDIPDATPNQTDNDCSGLHRLVVAGSGHFVLDIVELVYDWKVHDEKKAFRQQINQVLELHECPWRLSDGEFFKLDRDFVGARLAATAHESLAANHFAGAANEYAKSRQELGSGEVKDAIFHASKSFESVLKVLTGLDHANADRLIKETVNLGFWDDLPDNVRQGFADQVMKALPFLRNKLGGHGQGAVVVEVPAIYGELAIQLAAAYHNFLIAKHLQQQPAKPVTPSDSVPASDSDIPF